MAFTQNTFSPVAAHSTDTPNLFSYKTDDNITTVSTSGYFDDKRFQLEENDIIFARIGSDWYIIEITSTTTNVETQITTSGGSVAYENIQKIDSLSTDGLNGVSNSLAYRVHEIEKHFHSIERWFGNDGDNTGSVANNMTEWTLTAGTSSAYGTEVQLLAANDVNATDFGFTPVKFDLHRIGVTVSSNNDTNYIIQFWGGAGTFAEADLLTEIPYRTGGGQTESTPIDCQMNRQNVGNKIWARVKSEV